MTSRLLTNGKALTRNLAIELKNAGLGGFMFHIDSRQNRQGWTNKSEIEMNALRQHYADMVHEIAGLECGFHVTVYRSTLNDVADIVKWFNRNIHKVQHLALITYRGYPVMEGLKYFALGREVDIKKLRVSTSNIEDISITSEEVYDQISRVFPHYYPSAYSRGTTNDLSHKFLIIPTIGTVRQIHGEIGGCAIRLFFELNRFLRGKYGISANRLRLGKKVFLLSLIDKEIRRAFGSFLLSSLKEPGNLFLPVYFQTINIQQPLEVSNGKINLCKNCINPMLHNGELINSCRLDEYRIYGGAITPVPDDPTQARPT
jgi:hypothetical protein